jgi:hypothetical protein
MQWKKTSSGLDDIAVNHALTVHCKLDKVGHRSLCPPRNGTGVVLLETGMCRASLKEMSGSSYLSPHPKMSKIVQLLRSCCVPSLLRMSTRYSKKQVASGRKSSTAVSEREVQSRTEGLTSQGVLGTDQEKGKAAVRQVPQRT